MANDNFGLKIGLEGEKEFKEALKDINQSFKVLGSEMNLVSSEFDKNDKSIQAITARNQVLKFQMQVVELEQNIKSLILEQTRNPQRAGLIEDVIKDCEKTDS